MVSFSFVPGDRGRYRDAVARDKLAVTRSGQRMLVCAMLMLMCAMLMLESYSWRLGSAVIMLGQDGFELGGCSIDDPCKALA